MGSTRTPSAERLLTAAAHGDERAFAQFYDEVGPAVMGTVLSVIGDRSRAERVARDVFLDLWRTAAQYLPGRTGALTWSVFLARQRALDCVRRDHDIPSDTPSAVRLGLGERLAALTESERAAVQLAYCQGLTYGEIAHALHTSPETATSRLRAALRSLRGI